MPGGDFLAAATWVSSLRTPFPAHKMQEILALSLKAQPGQSPGLGTSEQRRHRMEARANEPHRRPRSAPFRVPATFRGGLRGHEQFLPLSLDSQRKAPNPPQAPRGSSEAPARWRCRARLIQVLARGGHQVSQRDRRSALVAGNFPDSDLGTSCSPGTNRRPIAFVIFLLPFRPFCLRGLTTLAIGPFMLFCSFYTIEYGFKQLYVRSIFTCS